MEDIVTDGTSLEIEGLSINEAKEFQKILAEFVKSYSAKAPNTSDEDWLYARFKEELPQLSDEECKRFSINTVDSIRDFDDNLQSITEASKNGVSSESWFAERISAFATGKSVDDYGNYINNLDNTISTANSQMMRAIIRKDGGINQSINLDGFIAEQAHVNKFNLEAELQKSQFRAEVCVPDSAYAKNSFDAVIKDVNTGRIVHQYQFKYGANAKATIRLIKSGDYNNQRLVVPVEQVSEVQQAFPGKTVEAFIGGTDTVIVQTEGITKLQVKEMQISVQKKEIMPRSDWNTYNTKALAINLGKQAGFMGLQAAAITAGFDLAAQAVSGKPIDTDETVKLAIESGADAGTKAAVTGALKVGVEKGILTVIPPGTPVTDIAFIASVSIENVKTLVKAAEGKLTVFEALENMRKNSAVLVAGLAGGTKGAIIGAAALSWIPIAGPIIGGFVGGVIGSMAGSKIGEAVYVGARKIAGVAKKTVQKTFEGIKNAASSIKNKVMDFIFG